MRWPFSILQIPFTWKRWTSPLDGHPLSLRCRSSLSREIISNSQRESFFITSKEVYFLLESMRISLSERGHLYLQDRASLFLEEEVPIDFTWRRWPSPLGGHLHLEEEVDFPSIWRKRWLSPVSLSLTDTEEEMGSPLGDHIPSLFWLGWRDGHLLLQVRDGHLLLPNEQTPIL